MDLDGFACPTEIASAAADAELLQLCGGRALLDERGLAGPLFERLAATRAGERRLRSVAPETSPECRDAVARYAGCAGSSGARRHLVRQAGYASFPIDG
jgi:hypothetical protein